MKELLMSLFGKSKGEVEKAVSDLLQGRIQKAEDDFLSGQEKIYQDAEAAEVALLQQIAKNVLLGQ